MAKTKSRALYYCARNRKRHQAGGAELKDCRLSDLPDEILLSIMPKAFSSMKDAVKASLLSRRWKHLWRYFPLLNFGDSTDKMSLIQRHCIKETSLEERSGFVKWVNTVVEGFLGSVIEELRVIFDLDASFQSHIDNWVAFAFGKQVKRLEFNFLSFSCQKRYLYCMSLPLECCMPPLTSLTLKYVNVSSEVIDHVLHICPLLEYLCIANSKIITRINSSSSSLPLRHFEVSSCSSLEIIDITCPKLSSFRYKGPKIELHVRNASSLSEVSLGSNFRQDAFDSFSEYFSQLEYLALRLDILHRINMGISHSSTLTNLKHLELYVLAKSAQSILGWTPLIEASPRLQRLTLKLRSFAYGFQREVIKRRGRPLKSLQILEIAGFSGHNIDTEFVGYVLNNAPRLKVVIVDIKTPLMFHTEPNKGALERAMKLRRELPQRIKFIFKQ